MGKRRKNQSSNWLRPFLYYIYVTPIDYVGAGLTLRGTTLYLTKLRKSILTIVYHPLCSNLIPCGQNVCKGYSTNALNILLPNGLSLKNTYSR